MYKIDINDNYLNSVKQLSFEHFIETFHLKLSYFSQITLTVESFKCFTEKKKKARKEQ